MSQIVTLIIVGAVSMASGAIICLAVCTARTHKALAAPMRASARVARPDQSVPHSLFSSRRH